MKQALVDEKSLGTYLNVPNIIQHSVSLTSEFAGQFRKPILEQDEWLYINISNFQLSFLEYFNEAYYAVSKYIWFPLLAKDEMQRDKLFLVSLKILEVMGILDVKKKNAMWVRESEWRRIYQYGDVLTIQKLHQLYPSVMKAMTHIGKQYHAKNIHTMLNDTCVRNHDYLYKTSIVCKQCTRSTTQDSSKHVCQSWRLNALDPIPPKVAGRITRILLLKGKIAQIPAFFENMIPRPVGSLISSGSSTLKRN